MALFSKIKNIFKKPEAKPKKKKPVKKERPGVKTAPEIKPEPIRKAAPKKKLGEVYRILKEPHISEKATQLYDENKYTFKIFPWANKVQVKNAVSDLYGVRVKDVKIINIKSKTRTLRGQKGKKHGYKKAIVVLEEGEKIEILPH
jgi:large subunit ribosomal protein L23